MDKLPGSSPFYVLCSQNSDIYIRSLCGFAKILHQTKILYLWKLPIVPCPLISIPSQKPALALLHLGTGLSQTLFSIRIIFVLTLLEFEGPHVKILKISRVLLRPARTCERTTISCKAICTMQCFGFFHLAGNCLPLSALL